MHYGADPVVPPTIALAVARVFVVSSTAAVEQAARIVTDDAVARSTSSYVWPTYPLETQLAGEERWTDITFRLGLIARLAGRTIEIV